MNQNFVLPLFKKLSTLKKILSLSTLFCLSGIISGCGSSSDSEESYGYLKFYNASSNSPATYLVVDDGDSETYLSSTSYGDATSLELFETDSYDLSLVWKSDAEDYETILESSVNIDADIINLLIMYGDFETPAIKHYAYKLEYETLFDDEDEDNFALYLINAKQSTESIDLYLSHADENFSQAEKISTLSFLDISSAIYNEVDEYKIYLTAENSDEILFESDEVKFSNNDTYTLIIREETGPSNSNYSIDVMGKTYFKNYSDIDSMSKVRVYNAMRQHTLLPKYSGELQVTVRNNKWQSEFSVLGYSEVSDAIEIESGDYAIDIKNSSGELMDSNHLLSLVGNDDKTVFIYLTEDYDDDTEGTDIYLNMLDVQNRTQSNSYLHTLDVINFTQDDNFNNVWIYFVREGESIVNAEYKISATKVNPVSIALPDDLYEMIAVTIIDDSRKILDSQALVLSGEQGNLFLTIEEDQASDSGYKMNLLAQ